MRVWLACVVVLWLVSAGWANDTWLVGDGGRVRRLKSEHATVRMVRESVRMDVYHAYYEVNATFLFRNEGPATTVTMGFPESGGGDLDGESYRRRTGFRHFATWVDGQPVRATRWASVGEMSYRAYWVKQVRFGKDQERTVRVRYQSPAGNDTTSTNYASYDFTGGNWRGKVDESVLRIVVHLPGTSFVDPGSEAARKGNEFVTRHTNWQAEGGGGIAYKQTMSGWMFVDGMYRDALAEPVAKWEAAARPGSGREFDWVEVTQAGIAEQLDWAPPALLRRGVVFLRADALCALFSPGVAGSYELLAKVLTWDPAAKEAVLYLNGRSFSFKRGRKTMVLDKRTEVPLPASPLLSSPSSGYVGGHLYVPVKPVLDVFGGTYTVSKSGHRLHIDLPKAEREPAS